jgi:hypothetical protein
MPYNSKRSTDCATLVLPSNRRVRVKIHLLLCWSQLKIPFGFTERIFLTLSHEDTKKRLRILSRFHRCYLRRELCGLAR